GAVRDPFGVSMAPLIERIGPMTFARDFLRGFGPGVAGLAAAMQQQHGRTAVAEHVGNKLVAGSADEGRSGGRWMPGHGRSLREFITVSLARSGLCGEWKGFPSSRRRARKIRKNRTFGTVAILAGLLSRILPVNRRSAMT